jgi:uncharacterized protein DUF4340
MQKRGFFLVLASAVVLVAAAAYSAVTADRAVSPPPAGARALPGLAGALGDLAWMRLTHGGVNTDFTAIGGRWVVVEKGNYAAAPGKVRRLLLGLADLTLVEPKTDRPDRLERLDLDDLKDGKSTLVALQDRTGATVARLIVGKSRPDLLGGGNDGVYVRKPDENQAWLARGSLDLADNATGWLDRRILDIAASDIAAVALTAADGTQLTLRRDAKTGRFEVANPPADAKFKSEEALAAPAAALAGLDLDDVSPAAELPVPAGGVAEAVFTTASGLTVTLRLFTHDKADWIAVAASGEGAAAADGAAAGAKLKPWVYAIAPDRAKLLRTTIADLLAPAKGS